MTEQELDLLHFRKHVYGTRTSKQIVDQIIAVLYRVRVPVIFEFGVRRRSGYAPADFALCP
jgi:hypothetical protein